MHAQTQPQTFWQNMFQTHLNWKQNWMQLSENKESLIQLIISVDHLLQLHGQSVNWKLAWSLWPWTRPSWWTASWASWLPLELLRLQSHRRTSWVVSKHSVLAWRWQKTSLKGFLLFFENLHTGPKVRFLIFFAVERSSCWNPTKAAFKSCKEFEACQHKIHWRSL